MPNIFTDSYADNSVCELGAGAAGVLCLVLGAAFVCACAYVCSGIGWVLGCPEIGAISGAFGIPILLVLANGWRS